MAYPFVCQVASPGLAYKFRARFADQVEPSKHTFEEVSQVTSQKLPAREGSRRGRSLPLDRPQSLERLLLYHIADALTCEVPSLFSATSGNSPAEYDAKLSQRGLQPELASMLALTGPIFDCGTSGKLSEHFAMCSPAGCALHAASCLRLSQAYKP